MSATAVTANGKKRLPTRDLARSLHGGIEWTERLLAESEVDGIVERIGDGWRLTTEAEARFGRHLRSLSVPRDRL